MPGVTRGNPRLMKCLLERLVVRAGFVLVHDGKNGEGQFNIDPSFYTRTYRLKLDGEFVNTWLKFKYDARSSLADLSMSWKDLDEWERVTEEEMVRAIPDMSSV